MPGVYMRMLVRQLLNHKGIEINSRELSLLTDELCGDQVYPYHFNGPRRYLQATGALKHPIAVSRRSVRCRWIMDRTMLEKLLEEAA